jgi:NitT/TauT family transport system permease protein
MSTARAARAVIPILVGLAFVIGWEALVAAYRIPRIVLPAPSAIVQALIDDFPSLMGSLWTTLRITLLAFGLAVVTGVALAVLFSQSRIV